MKFVREIPAERLVDKVVNDLEQQGFTLVWLKDSLEIWADTDVKEEMKKAA